MTTYEPNAPTPHRVAIVLFDDVVLADALVAYQTFAKAKLSNGEFAYDVYFCAEDSHNTTSGLSLNTPNPLIDMINADTVVIPGTENIERLASEQLSKLLCAHLDNSKRLISICTGAFMVASCGVLDGLKVTTHWMYAETLQKRYPKLTVNPDVLYIDNDRILTSAGAMAGLDLCLYVVECDFGSLVAVNLAKFSVVPIHRQGGQKQFIDHQYSTDNRNDIYHLISWMKENLTCDFSVDELASYACMAPRTLNRKFKNELGISPFEWLKLTRIRHAKLLLESTSLNIDQVSHNSGLGSSKNMRAQFKKVVGVTPTEYRKSFQRS